MLMIFSLIFLLAAAQAPNSVFIEELTWDEIRDAMKAGKTSVIIPAGGTEQNGIHVVMGKHNVVVKNAAEKMARKLGNALVAPVLTYVPEGDPNSPNFGRYPGVISCPGQCFTTVLEFASRSLKAGGFKEILLIGDSGSDQAGIQEVATKLNKEWDGTGARVFPLTEYYSKGRENHRAWLLSEFGYDEETVGSHAGITGTSQVLHVNPGGVRWKKIFEVQDNEGSSGNPKLATAEIGKMIIEFKVNAGINQYKALKTPARTQAPAPVLENEFVRVYKNAAPCANAGPACAERVIVALGPIDIGLQRMNRGDVKVFKTGERYAAPTGAFAEVVMKPQRPAVKTPGVSIAPDKNSFLYDGERFFIFEENLPIGDTRERHSHNQRVVIVINETRLQQWPDGQPEFFRDSIPDDIRFNEPTVHVVKNIGKNPMRNIVIELKP